MQQHGQFTVEFRAVRVDGSVRWMVVPRPRRQRRPRRAGAPARHDPRRHRCAAAGRRSGCRPCSARRRSPRSPPSSPTRRGWSELPEIVLRGAAGARRRVQRAGRLRPRRRAAAAAHDQPAHRRDPGPRRVPGRRGRDRARRLPADPVRRDARPAGAAGRPRGGARPVPGDGEGLEVLGIRAVAALPLRVEGRVLGAFVAALGRPTTRSPPTTSRCWRRSPRRSR